VKRRASAARGRKSPAKASARSRRKDGVKLVTRTQVITPFLWYDGHAEDAAKFYCSVFRNSRIVKVSRYPEGAPAPAGSVMTVEFELAGQKFIALNAGPMFKFNESVSFVVECADQGEVDYYWEKLQAGGGSPSQCGWLKDRFGLSWQVTPRQMGALYARGGEAAERVMKSMMTMAKLDIATLEAAARGTTPAPRQKKRA
jgi:predicted 3-demethylubiquinone-9 3-methyltransferase (glyoxalase superfamily)